MTAAPQPDDPGATPVAARALAPDLARGGMLLLIALANVHMFLYGRSLGVRGYPRDVEGIDRVVALLQMTLVDGRAYPLFGLLFGYGIVQLSRRQEAVGRSGAAVTRLVRRRGCWMIAIGLVHGLLLWSGDIVGAYGLLAVVLAGALVRGTDVTLLTIAMVGIAFTTLFYSSSGMAAGDPQTSLPSTGVQNPLAAAVTRLGEWVGAGFLLQALAVLGAVALGAWTARRRLLDEPERHRTLLIQVAVLGLATAVLAGLPMALMASAFWTAPPLLAVLVSGSLHAFGGFAGGVGYAAAFGLLAIRSGKREQQGPVTWAVAACGQRSLSCYLAQSIAFVALLPAWTLGLGAHARLWQAALLAAGTWLVILLVAAASARVGYRGPAELLLRRLTYGRRRPTGRTGPARGPRVNA